MTLLVDTQSELQDVKEAHLRFERDAFQPGAKCGPASQVDVGFFVRLFF